MCGNVTGSDGLWGKLDPTSSAIAKRTGYDPGHFFTDPVDPNAAANAAAKAEAARQAQIQSSMDAVDSLFGGADRQAQYKTYGADTFNLLKDSLDQNEKTASRNLGFGLSRSGNLGGSEDVEQHGLLQKDYSQGLLDASNKAQGAEAQLEGEDNSLKSNIDNLILNGMSATTAEQQAQEGMSSNLAGASSLVAPAALDQTFGDLATAYLNGKAQQGTSAANAKLGSQFQASIDQQPMTDPSQWGADWLNLGGPT